MIFLIMIKMETAIFLTDKEINTLTYALDCLVNIEQDTINHTELYEKLYKRGVKEIKPIKN